MKMSQRINVGRAVMAALAFVVGMGMIGCAQSTEQGTRQDTVTIPATTQMQDQMAPKRLMVQFNIHPERGYRGDDSGWREGDAIAALAGNPNQSDDHRQYHVNVGNISVTEGGTTSPSMAGESTGTSTATATPTLTATQDIKPEIGISVPIGVAMPGGVVDQVSAALGGKGQISDLTQTAQHELRTAFLKGLKSNDMTPFLNLARDLLGVEDAATAPAAPGG